MTSTHRPRHLLRLRLVAALSLALPACPGETHETTSDAGTTGDATGTTGDATTSTPTSSGDTSGATSASGAETSTSATTSGTGGGDPLQDSCEGACEVLYACAPRDFESEAQCVANCLEGPVPMPSEGCDAAYIALNQCFAQSTCPPPNTEGPCGAEYDALFAACGGDACDVTAIGDATGCLILETCIDGETELYCEGPTCSCRVHGDEVGSCENDVCVDGVDEAALKAKALSCCGFAF